MDDDEYCEKLDVLGLTQVAAGQFLEANEHRAAMRS
jgi:hypothetical protein